MITRENYEEYFLLYVDNELPAAARSAVEKYVADNPDLQEEWETLLQCRVHPDRHEVFPETESLLQQDLLSYVDGELDEEGRRSVEEFVGRYPSKAVELQQLLLTVSQPDLSITFPGKESLYHSGRRRVLLLPWMQAGIAAAVLGLVALLLLTHHQKEIPHVAQNTQPSSAKKKAQSPVTPATPAPLYSTGNNDQHQADPIVKNDPSTRKEQRKAEMAPVEKEPDVTGRQQELAVTTTALTTTATRTDDPVSIADIRPDEATNTGIKPAAMVAAVNIPKEQSSFATQALLEEAQSEETKDLVAAAPAGKSKLRGLFRKVSRTFGKTAERDDDGQKSVLISAFQVELK